MFLQIQKKLCSHAHFQLFKVVQAYNIEKLRMGLGTRLVKSFVSLSIRGEAWAWLETIVDWDVCTHVTTSPDLEVVKGGRHTRYTIYSV